MSIFLLFQANYQTYEVGIFSDTTCLDSFIEDKKYSSRDLIPTIQMLLERNALTWDSIAALGVNQGPGPFTSLRVIITTANGLSFATGIPLIGINSLEALLLENHDAQWPISVALLNAFNNDLYYAIQTPDDLEIGCENTLQLFASLKERFGNKKIRFLGNGAALFKKELCALLGDQAIIQDPLSEVCSLNQIGLMTAAAFSHKETLQDQLLPIYLKNVCYVAQV